MIKKIFNKVKEKFKDLFKGKETEVREVKKPMKEVGKKEVKDAIIRDRAQAKGKNVRLENKIKRMQRQAEVEEEIEMKKQASEKVKEKMIRIIEEGKHTRFDGRYLVIGRDSKFIGELISLIEWRGGTYVYVDLPNGKRTLYGDDGVTRRNTIYYYENLHDQLHVPLDWIDGYIIINYPKGEKRNLIPQKRVVV